MLNNSQQLKQSAEANANGQYFIMPQVYICMPRDGEQPQMQQFYNNTPDQFQY
jgi:hypothetical protein